MGTRFILLASVLIIACSPSEPRIENAWLRAAPDGNALGAAYLDIHNGARHDWVVAFRSDAHESVSLHETTLENGMSRMRQITRLELMPGETVFLQPGGLHLMLSSARRRLIVGDQVQLTLSLASGRVIHSQAMVSRNKP